MSIYTHGTNDLSASTLSAVAVLLILSFFFMCNLGYAPAKNDFLFERVCIFTIQNLHN